MLRLAFSMLAATVAVALLAGAVINGKLTVPLPRRQPAAAVAVAEPLPPPAPAPAPVETNSSTADQSRDEVEIVPNSRGGYETDIYIRGRAVHVEVDTGATFLSLTYQDAMAVGLHLTGSDFRYQTSTANGIGRVAKVHLNEVRIGDFSIYDVDALVSQPWALRTSLLGMNVLSRLGGVHIADGRLVLQH
ncbi:MAG TPA: TIGR02281 family clan AA aspartic protease [Rhizobiaceae bacterium]|nr:TIGR02281 family clan AA aspartic protease [Rhizobiaceae bacterium]